MKYMLFLLAALALQTPALAKHDSDHPLTPEEWHEVGQRIDLLEGATFLPSLLPIVMENRDALALTEAQLQEFDRWRRENFVPMVNLMNRIIELKVQFSVESVSPEVSSEHLFKFQQQIQQLQQELLKNRMSCREAIMRSFTREQWEDFEFIAADYPRLASFISLRNEIRAHDKH